MSKRPLAALKELYEDPDENPDLEYVTVLFDDKSAAGAFEAWAKERTAKTSAGQSISLQPFQDKHFLVSFQTFAEGEGENADYRNEVDAYLRRFNIPVFSGASYNWGWDGNDVRAVQRLAYGEDACKKDDRVKWELQGRFAETLQKGGRY